MSSTATSTSTYTIVQTATHLADVILGSIVDILGTLGIDPTRLFGDWEQDQAAISAWIRERSLNCVVLECHQPSGIVSPIFEFPVVYRATGEGDRNFTADRATFARYLAKLKSVSPRTEFRLFCSFSTEHSSQPGWGPGTRSSTTGMRSYGYGTLAGAPHASASLRYFTR